MRSLVVAALVASPLACASTPAPPPAPVTPAPSLAPPPVAPSEPAAALERDAPPAGEAPLGGEVAALADVPRVVRRIVAEEKDLIARSAAMANELPDPSGRRRALDEAAALAEELAKIEAPLAGADSDRLDAIVDELFRIEGRVARLYESLRVATNRTTAVAAE